MRTVTYDGEEYYVAADFKPQGYEEGTRKLVLINFETREVVHVVTKGDEIEAELRRDDVPRERVQSVVYLIMPNRAGGGSRTMAEKVLGCDPAKVGREFRPHFHETLEAAREQRDAEAARLSYDGFGVYEGRLEVVKRVWDDEKK
jgi:hypothetical protein